jgi:bifunctional oligoribonuclease and PAP phosphatase NrnA
MPHRTDIEGVADALRTHERFVVTTHENPDGDALGSLLGLHLALGSLGKDSVMVIGGDQPLPPEYRFLPLEESGLLRARPDDASERVLVAVDCAQANRIADATLLPGAPLVVNVDHHHDNTRFGTVDLVVPDASSTGEVLADVMHELGVRLTPAIAEALYTALVTDTGRFQYSNTTPKALRLAAELVEAGADVRRVFQGVYESLEFDRLKLLGSALRHATVHEGGRVVIAHLTRADFAEVGTEEPSSEGIIDHLRAVEGTELAALIRELPPGGPACKVSLRASIDTLDVSAIARQSSGGGHRQAAGFSSDLDVEGVRAFVLDAYRRAISER